MFIKWIVCEVPYAFRREFSKAQEKWSRIKEVKGFIGQAGGWDEQDGNDACILSLWRDPDSHEYFMKRTHDIIFFDTHQSRYYNRLDIQFFELMYEMIPPMSPIASALIDAKMLRVDIFKSEHTGRGQIEQLSNTWMIDMKNKREILIGAFLRNIANPSELMLVSFWKSGHSHKRSLDEIFPALKIMIRNTASFTHLKSRQVHLQEYWKILPFHF